MKILFINGSPRKNGNSDFITRELKKYCLSEEVACKEFYLRDLKINPCIACDLCHSEEHKCIAKDDFSKILFPRIIKVDAIFLISPVYQGGVTGITKNFMDRCEIFRKGRLLRGKLCGGAVIGGYAGGGQELCLMQIEHFSHICAMRYVASWGKTRSHLGGYCVAYEKGEVAQDEEGITSCKNVVKEMINLFNFTKGK